MVPSELLAVLIVDPTASFDDLEAALVSLGWVRDERGPVLPPLRAGEPELAGWAWQGRRPSITYTFNPVPGLRVLDLSRVPPRLRARISESVPHLNAEQLASMLGHGDARRRLLAILALGELEIIELAGAVARLIDDPERAVATAARNTAAALARKDEARRDTFAMLGVLYETVRPLLRGLTTAEGPALIESLRPHPDDYAKIFAAELADAIAVAYDHLWRTPPRIRAEPDGRIDIHGAPAGLLRSPNELSRAFPGGYRAVAGHLRPERVWICWRYAAHGAERGSLYDGLVQLEGRWIWCPKPYRVIGEVLRDRGELAE